MSSLDLVLVGVGLVLVSLAFWACERAATAFRMFRDTLASATDKTDGVTMKAIAMLDEVRKSQAEIRHRLDRLEAMLDQRKALMTPYNVADAGFRRTKAGQPKPQPQANPPPLPPIPPLPPPVKPS